MLKEKEILVSFLAVFVYGIEFNEDSWLFSDPEAQFIHTIKYASELLSKTTETCVREGQGRCGNGQRG